MTWRTISEVLGAEFVEASRVSPPPADQADGEALAARPPVWVGGTNYLPWLHVRLFLEYQTAEAQQHDAAGRECDTPAACCVASKEDPDGNHGETLSRESEA